MRKHLIILILILVIGSFLRLYRLEDFATFLGDQGRDAIIIKRLLTFENLPAIGPVTSIGQIYLGPFYYYLMAPWLLLSWFQPIGLVLGVAILSILGIGIVYWMVKDIFDKETALITTVLISFSSILIEFARFSWNPNLLPFFAFFTFYTTYKAIQTHKSHYFIFTGVLLSCSLQLHYLGLFLIPAASLLFLLHIFENKKQSGLIMKQWLFMITSFGISTSPLLLFDLKHGFVNTKAFMKLITASSTVTRNIFVETLRSFELLYSYVFVQSPANLMVLLLFVILMLFCIVGMIKRGVLGALCIYFLFLLIGVALYSGPKYQHYLGILFVFFLVIVAYLLSYATQKRWGWYMIGFSLGVYIMLNSSRYYFLHQNPSHQIRRSKVISEIIKDQVTARKYALTMLPERSFDSTYRYFLEIGGKPPLEKDVLEKADELFVVCEGQCKPIGNPQWDIAYFAPNKIVSVTAVKGHIDYTVYKLVK